MDDIYNEPEVYVAGGGEIPPELLFSEEEERLIESELEELYEDTNIEKEIIEIMFLNKSLRNNFNNLQAINNLSQDKKKLLFIEMIKSLEEEARNGI